MGGITTIFLLLAAILSVGLFRVARQRTQIEARTQEWIKFLQEDLSTSSL